MAHVVRNFLSGLTCVTMFFGFMSTAEAEVILHAFDWKYKDVEKSADAIATAGYKAVLVAPPLKTERSTDCPWYKRYQPEDFRVIDGCTGNKTEFEGMVKALGKKNLVVYADIVVNHMANESNNTTVFPGDETLKSYAAKPDYWSKQRLFGDLKVGLFSPQDFHAERCIHDYGSVDEVINGRICGPGGDRGLPDLNDGVGWVLDQRREYIKALFALGVRGFRIDAAKHMTTDAIRSFIPDDIASNSFVFGEIITWGGTSDREYDLYLKPYLQRLPVTFGAYDFPLLNAIKRAFSVGANLGDFLAKPYDTGNALESRRAVVVAITHDIPYNESFRSLLLDPKDEEIAYAYILGRDGGVPMVFDDGTSWKSDKGRWVGAWKNDRLKKMIGFHNRMQGKRMNVIHADACSLLWRREEDGIAGINKCEGEIKVTVDTHNRFKWNVTYVDALDPQTTLKITSGSCEVSLPGRSARLYYVR